MTVSTSQIRVSYVGDGATVNFPIPYPFYLATDLLIILAGSTIATGYSVSGGGGSAGTLTMTTAPTSAQILQIILNVPLTQLTNLVDGTEFPSATINQVNDRAIQAALRLQDQISRSVRAPDGDNSPGMQLPSASSRASMYLAFDENGNILPTAALPGTANTQASIGPILNPQTAAEAEAGVTPTNYAYPPGHAFRYGAVGDGTTDDSAAVQATLTVAAAYEALTRTSAQRNINPAYFPGGAYLIKTPLTVPNGNGISVTCSNDAWFFYNDTVSPGSYMLTFGASGGGISGVGWDRLRINLLTVTAKGVNFINCQDSYLDDYYCQGLVVAAGSMSSRTNVGLRIEATTGQQSFWIRFGNVHLNHMHTGILVPDSGGFVGQQEIRFLNLFGDANNGDQAARGIDAVAGQDWIIHGGYVESYYNAAGVGGIKLATTKCVRWKVSKVVFDVGGSLSGQMNAILLAGPGAPQSNQFLGCMIDPGTQSVIDGSACTDDNLIENNPNISQTWTATLVPGTSGTIALTSGLAGNQCFCIKRGNEVHIWGYLNVASVASPVGRLFLQGLPFTSANNNANQMPVTVRMDGLNATAATMMQGYVNRNSTQLEFEHFAAGAAGGSAADIKAGTNIYFDCTYIAATAI